MPSVLELTELTVSCSQVTVRAVNVSVSGEPSLGSEPVEMELPSLNVMVPPVI